MIKKLVQLLPHILYTRFLNTYHHHRSLMRVGGINIRMTSGIRKNSAQKEPETIAWINSFSQNTIFYDVGANVGAYSLYAAKKGATKRIYAFEPGVPTFEILMKNVETNHVSDVVIPIISPLDKNSKFDVFNYSTNHKGGSQNLFGTTNDQNGEQVVVKQRHGVIGVSIDDMVTIYGLEAPDYLKIDVDGNDLEILKGAVKVLEKYKPEIYIEYNAKKSTRDISDFLSVYNYKWVRSDKYDDVTGMALFR